MHTFTLYDSAFTHKNRNLSPVQHLRCDLKLTEDSKALLKERGIITEDDLKQKKFPTILRCVLTDIPQIAFSSEWKEGATTHMFVPITNFLNENTLGKAVQIAAGGNFIPIVPTNEFSQKIQESVCRPSLKLKFVIYTDTYNKRYNFVSSPYETWLRMLYFSTTPLLRATYKNLLSSFKAAGTNISRESGNIAEIATDLEEGASALLDSLPFFEDKGGGNKESAAKAIAALDKLQTTIMTYLMQSNKTGHIGWDIIIPNYLHQTDNSPQAITWNVESFDVSFSDKFTRGIRNPNNVQSSYRPRPLYAEFEVTMRANQCMSRDQYIKMLFGDVYKELFVKKQEAPADKPAPN